MAYARSAIAPREFVSPPASAPASQPVSAPAKRGVWRLLLDAIYASRQRQAEHEIARYLYSVGGKFTDDAEREIERRFLGSSRH
jgi:hypothetical protein